MKLSTAAKVLRPMRVRMLRLLRTGKAQRRRAKCVRTLWISAISFRRLQRRAAPRLAPKSTGEVSCHSFAAGGVIQGTGYSSGIGGIRVIRCIALRATSGGSSTMTENMTGPATFMMCRLIRSKRIRIRPARKPPRQGDGLRLSWIR